MRYTPFLLVLALFPLGITQSFADSADTVTGLTAIDRQDRDTAVAIFKPLANERHPSALYGLGMVYLRLGCDDGTKSDNPLCLQQAVTLITRAAELDEPKANEMLGMWYENGSATKAQDAVLAERAYEAAGRTGDVYALINAARLSSDPAGGARDGERAMRLYNQAYEAGSGFAAFRIGEMLRIGDVIQKEYTTAAAWYEKAEQATEPNHEAAYWCGYLYEHGMGVLENDSTALDWYLKSAVDIRPQGKTAVARMYYEGKGTAQDFGAALKYTALALRSVRGTEDNPSVAEAHLLASKFYQSGHVLQQDAKKARMMVHAAAYLQDSVALEATRQDAIGGDADAQYILGKIAREINDNKTAEAWFNKSATQGNLYALSALAPIASEAGDFEKANKIIRQVADRMTTEGYSSDGIPIHQIFEEDVQRAFKAQDSDLFKN